MPTRPGADVYTDGPLLEGMAAFAFHAKVLDEVLELSGALGLGSSVYRAELTAILAALRDHRLPPHSTIWCDNQAAVRAIGGPPSPDPVISEIQMQGVRLNTIFCWLPGHRGIPGNEAAAASAPPRPAHFTELAPTRLLLKQVTHALWEQEPHASSRSVYRTTVDPIRARSAHRRCDALSRRALFLFPLFRPHLLRPSAHEPRQLPSHIEDTPLPLRPHVRLDIL